MTPEELKEIEERCNKATPGPWYFHPGDSYCAFPSIMTRNKHFLVFDIADDAPTEFPGRDEDADFVAHARDSIPSLLAYIKELESQIPRWIPITVAVPDEHEIVLFKMVEWIALKGEEKPMRESDPIPDIGEVFPEKIETCTSYFTGYRIGDVYRDHAHNCIRNYARLEWVRIFKEED